MDGLMKAAIIISVVFAFILYPFVHGQVQGVLDHDMAVCEELSDVEHVVKVIDKGFSHNINTITFYQYDTNTTTVYAHDNSGSVYSKVKIGNTYNVTYNYFPMMKKWEEGQIRTIDGVVIE